MTQVRLIWFINQAHESIIESSFELFTSWLESLPALFLTIRLDDQTKIILIHRHSRNINKNYEMKCIEMN
jgi:hypothetical protein